MITFIGYLVVGYIVPSIISLFVIRFCNKRERNRYDRVEACFAFIPIINILACVIGLIACPIVWIFEQPTTQHFLAAMNKFVNFK